MGRKQKKGSANKQSAIPHKEAFQRMNYLLQVSIKLMFSILLGFIYYVPSTGSHDSSVLNP